MSVADHSDKPSEKRAKPALVSRFLGFLGFASPKVQEGEDFVLDSNTPPPAPKPAASPSPTNGIHVENEETLNELVRLAEANPSPSHRSALEDTRIIMLGKQSDELSRALVKKGDTCKRRLSNIRERIEQQIKEAESDTAPAD